MTPNSKAYLIQKLIFAILTLTCMILIFRFSMDDSGRSAKKSGKVTETIVETVVKDYDEMPAEKRETIRQKAEHIVRKCAHFTVFMLLGLMSSCTVGRRRLLSRGSLGVLVFCFLYACSDEIHQHFVPGRACQFTDVLIDTGGALTGLILSMICFAVISAIADREKRSKKAAQYYSFIV